MKLIHKVPLHTQYFPLTFEVYISYVTPLNSFENREKSDQYFEISANFDLIFSGEGVEIEKI